ncbi:MAG: hypothetical protein EA352_10520 [Gemmatimonadales bacterium]|nr:MAG: hypothetical protein EA352_10520 [Gemmatimonadales bacterium]
MTDLTVWLDEDLPSLSTLFLDEDDELDDEDLDEDDDWDDEDDWDDDEWDDWDEDDDEDDAPRKSRPSDDWD